MRAPQSPAITSQGGSHGTRAWSRNCKEAELNRRSRPHPRGERVALMASGREEFQVTALGPDDGSDGDGSVERRQPSTFRGREAQEVDVSDLLVRRGTRRAEEPGVA